MLGSREAGEFGEVLGFAAVGEGVEGEEDACAGGGGGVECTEVIGGSCSSPNG